MLRVKGKRWGASDPQKLRVKYIKGRKVIKLCNSCSLFPFQKEVRNSNIMPHATPRAIFAIVYYCFFQPTGKGWVDDGGNAKISFSFCLIFFPLGKLSTLSEWHWVLLFFCHQRESYTILVPSTSGCSSFWWEVLFWRKFTMAYFWMINTNRTSQRSSILLGVTRKCYLNF